MSDPYYDLIEDFDLILSSFQAQYGLRLKEELKNGMKWDEFSALLSGISPDTPLGRIVSIRAENDKNILKNFTPEQKRIRNAWRSRRAKQMSMKDRDAYVEMWRQAFISMAGKEGE